MPAAALHPSLVPQGFLKPFIRLRQFRQFSEICADMALKPHIVIGARRLILVQFLEARGERSLIVCAGGDF